MKVIISRVFVEIENHHFLLLKLTRVLFYRGRGRCGQEKCVIPLNIRQQSWVQTFKFLHTHYIQNYVFFFNSFKRILVSNDIDIWWKPRKHMKRCCLGSWYLMTKMTQKRKKRKFVLSNELKNAWEQFVSNSTYLWCIHSMPRRLSLHIFDDPIPCTFLGQNFHGSLPLFSTVHLLFWLPFSCQSPPLSTTQILLTELYIYFF